MMNGFTQKMKTERHWLANGTFKSADEVTSVHQLCATTFQGVDQKARQRATHPAQSKDCDQAPLIAVADFNPMLAGRAVWFAMREFEITPKTCPCLQASIQALGYANDGWQMEGSEIWRSWGTTSGISGPACAPSGRGVLGAVFRVYLPGNPSAGIEQMYIMPSIVTVRTLATLFPARPLVAFYSEGSRLEEIRCKQLIQYSFQNSLHINITHMNVQITSIQDDELYTRKEVAMLAKVCVHTIARDVRAGRLPEIRFNRRRLRHRGREVKEYLAANYELGIQHTNSSPPANNTRVGRKVDLNNDGNNDSRVIEAAKTGKVADSAAENPPIPQDSAKKPGRQGKKTYNQVLLAHSRRFAVLGLFVPSFGLN